MSTFSEYFNLTRGDVIVSNEDGNEIRAGTECGPQSDSSVDESNVDLIKSDSIEQVSTFNNIKDIFANARRESKERLKESVMEAEYQLHNYDSAVNRVRGGSLKLLLKSILWLHIVVHSLLVIWIFVIRDGLSLTRIVQSINDAISIITADVMDSIEFMFVLLVMWFVVFGVQWFNRHKMSYKFPLSVIRIVYYVPFVLSFAYFCAMSFALLT